MKIRKLLLLALAFMVGLTLVLTGCDQTANDKKAYSLKDQSSVTPRPFDKNVVPTSKYENGYKYDPPVTVSVVRYYGPQVKFQPGENIDNNVWTKAYEEYCGIKLKSLWTVTDSTKFDLKITTSIATNTLPDIIPVYTTLFFRVADSGRFMNLKPYYDKYLDPTLKTSMEVANAGIAYKTCFRNNILAALAAPTGKGGNMQWIRQDWLDKYNRPWPKNINESIDLMKFFCKKNPGAPASPQTFAFPLPVTIATGFENAFGAYAKMWLDDGNGGLVRSDISPKWKPVLQILSDMYADQYIDNDFALNAQSVIDTQMTNQQFGFMFGAKTAPDGTLYNTIGYNPKAVWKSGLITDETGAPAKIGIGTRIGGFTGINVNSQYPESVILLANVYDDLMNGIGIEFRKYHDFKGTDGANYDSFFYPFIGWYYPPIDFPKVIATAQKTKDFSKLTGEQLGILDKFKIWTENKDPYGWRLWAILTPGGSAETEQKIIDNNYLYPDRGWGPETQAWIDKGPDLYRKNDEAFALMVRGDKTIDEGFQEWVDYFTNNGGTEATTEINAWWKTEGQAVFASYFDAAP
ncbi:MAG: hypothetical protein WCL54_06995 [Clostridia bacterium]